MAPPTIAPPMRPAATPAATPRCALAGLAASAPATVATARKAESVFFISWSLLEDGAVNSGAGFKVYSRRIRNRLSRQKAHNRQLEVNASYPSAEKTVFSSRIAKTFRKQMLP